MVYRIPQTWNKGERRWTRNVGRSGIYKYSPVALAVMTPTMKGVQNPQKKPTSTKAYVDKDEENPEIVITLNREHPSTREEFVIDVLESAGEEGVYINELLRGWNAYRVALHKTPSNYAAFRKLIWNMKQKGIIERVPDYEKRDKDLKGKGQFLRSFYRLTARFLDSHI